MSKTTLKLIAGYYTGYILGWVGVFVILAVIGGLA